MADQRPAKRQKAVHPIDAANQHSDQDFLKDYVRPKPGWQNWTHPSTAQAHTIRFSSAPNLSSEDLDACYRLVEETSRKDYENSSVGWNEVAKRQEMRERELRYVLVEAEEEADAMNGNKGGDGAKERRGHGRLRGFTSMMPTFEQGEAVVYCYEIHVQPYLQGTGLAQLLMSFVTSTTMHIPTVSKTMLTCFTSNTRGTKFYERLGFTVDEAHSPRERRLRGGKVVKPDYVILSKVEEKEETVLVDVNGSGAGGRGSL